MQADETEQQAHKTLRAIDEPWEDFCKDKARLEWLESLSVTVRDDHDRLVFYRGPGASPLRKYIDDSAEAIKALNEAEATDAK